MAEFPTFEDIPIRKTEGELERGKQRSMIEPKKPDDAEPPKEVPGRKESRDEVNKAYEDLVAEKMGWRRTADNIKSTKARDALIAKDRRAFFGLPETATDEELAQARKNFIDKRARKGRDE